MDRTRSARLSSGLARSYLGMDREAGGRDVADAALMRDGGAMILKSSILRLGPVDNAEIRGLLLKRPDPPHTGASGS